MSGLVVWCVILVALTALLWAFVAWRDRRRSPGPLGRPDDVAHAEAIAMAKSLQQVRWGGSAGQP